MTPNNALEFKGRMLSLTRARVLSSDLAAITAQLRDFARQMPQAVQGMPIVLDADEPLAIESILKALREVGMQPVGVVDGALAAAGRKLGLPVLPPESSSAKLRAANATAHAQTGKPAPVETAVAPAHRATRIISEPVRSGQQIYVADGDLIVTSTVSPGAEIVADGCVHIYGTLRGRAIAGARGDVTGRIFCHRFEAELVAVAGVYAVAEQMQGNLRGQPAQVVLADGKLKIERLDG
jgi:septum site-determining protein MinC